VLEAAHARVVDPAATGARVEELAIAGPKRRLAAKRARIPTAVR
jgi:hypothetical protein